MLGLTDEHVHGEDREAADGEHVLPLRSARDNKTKLDHDHHLVDGGEARCVPFRSVPH